MHTCRLASLADQACRAAAPRLVHCANLTVRSLTPCWCSDTLPDCRDRVMQHVFLKLQQLCSAPPLPTTHSRGPGAGSSHTRLRKPLAAESPLRSRQALSDPASHDSQSQLVSWWDA